MSGSTSKTILITGGASGIGAAAAREAVSRGHRVLVSDIDLAAAERLATDLGQQAVRLDITSTDEWEQALDRAWDYFRRLDVLINNAGIARPGNSVSVPLEDHLLTMDVNFQGPMRGVLAAMPRFTRQGSGQIVTVCSTTSYVPFPGLASYAASKHALRAFHHAVALEERAGSVKFSIIHPSATETPMLDYEAQFDDMALAFAGASMPAEQVAQVIIDAMEAQSVEVCIPEDRADLIQRIGTNPADLLKMVESGLEVGRQKMLARRAARHSADG